MNKRLNDINLFIDNNFINTNIIELMNKYSNELTDYKYIDNLIEFSLLKLKGSIRYINIYDNKLRYGGLLIKIYKNNNNKWISIIKTNNKKYYINFNNNYIFYKESKEENLISWANLFIEDVNNNKYDF
jgi:hypothetical protein